MSFDEALETFRNAVENLKKTYTDENGGSSCELMILVNEYDTITIIPTNRYGNTVDCFRD